MKESWGRGVDKGGQRKGEGVRGKGGREITKLRKSFKGKNRRECNGG